jgi:hypothetical protein
MKQDNRKAAFNAAMDELLNQWWDLELVADVTYWLQKFVENRDGSAQGYIHARLQIAVTALRIWREQTQDVTTPQADLAPGTN